MMIDRIARCGMVVLAGLALGACGSKDNDTAEQADSTAVPSVAEAPVAPSATDTPSAPAPADSAASDPANWVLREDGAGPVRVGMTVAEANGAVPGGLNKTTGLESCDFVQPKNGPANVMFMVVDGRIARADVVRDAKVATVTGLRNGETETAVRAAYPNARVQPHKYTDGHYVVVIPGAPADTLHRLVFETDGTKVLRMRGGIFPPVEYVEGCS